MTDDLGARATVGAAAITAETVARWFHEAYERLAPDYSYRTRKASAVPWDEVPVANRALMVRTASEVLDRLRGAAPSATGSASELLATANLADGTLGADAGDREPRP